MLKEKRLNVKACRHPAEHFETWEKNCAKLAMNVFLILKISRINYEQENNLTQYIFILCIF